MMTPAQQIAVWADRLRDISARGLRYCQNIYDRENYQIIQDMALEMLALATNALPEQIEALRAPLFTRPGPFPFGDAAIIDETGRILLIKRADNQMWAMPGGGMDVGETPAEGVVREALEETGLRVEPLTLVGVYDSRLCGTLTRHQLYQFVFLCRPIDNEARQQPALHAHEVLDQAWFAEETLPTDIDPGHIGRIPDAFRVWHGQQRAYFDH